MTPLKIKITVRDCALEMQVLEQDERLRGTERKDVHIFSIGSMYIASMARPQLYDEAIYVRGYMREEDDYRSRLTFTSNTDRDAYLARVKRLIHDFRAAWKAGEVEVGR